MPPKKSPYICEKCGHKFKQKSGYDDHMSRKTDCSETTAINEIVQTTIEKTVKKAVKETLEEIGVKPAPVTNDKNSMQKFFEDLHNLLWNKAGLNPERALEHMTFFFAYRLLEEQADTLKLPKECRWSEIASLKNENDLFDAVIAGTKEFRRNPITKTFFKPHEITKASIVSEIVQHINKIPIDTLKETDALGDIFEYMLGRGMSTMSDEGQYFTNRPLCKLAFKFSHKIKKTLRRPDGTLCTFADWFCGTGGFPAAYIKGVNEHLPDIDWKRDKASIYCQDMNMSSVTTTLLNLLILTGIPFSSDRIRSGNSFTDPIFMGSTAPHKDLAIDYCFMNPPYGGDKTKGKEYKFAYSKGKGDAKKYLVNSEIQSIGIEDDDKVSAGVQLAMASLAKDGVCAIVLPQGFFFGAGKKCIDLRKKLIEEYKVHYVFDIQSGEFKNTGTKTSMMIFQKGCGPTDKITFIGLTKTKLPETQEEIFIENTLCEASADQLRGKNYSLNYTQYIPRATVDIQGFEMVKLGDILKPKSVKSHSTTDGLDSGKYPLISSALNVDYYMDTFDCDIPSLIFNTINADGNGTVHYYEKFNVTTNTYVLSCDSIITLKYIYNYLKNNKHLLKLCFEGTTKKALSRTLLLNVEIPLPSLEHQQQIVDAIDGWTQLAHNEEVGLKILEKQVMFEVKEMGRGKPMVKLGDLIISDSGNILSKHLIVDGKYPIIGGGKIVGYHNMSNRNAYEIVLSRVGNACLTFMNEKYYLTDNALAIVSKDSSKMLIQYLYYYLTQNMDILREQYNGTAQPVISKTRLYDIQMPLTSITEQLTLQPHFDEIRHKHEKIALYKAKAQEAIDKLIPK